MIDLKTMLHYQVGFLTACQLALIITGSVYGVLIAHEYANDIDCQVGFYEDNPSHFETAQIVLLSVALAVILVMLGTRFRQPNFFSSEQEDKYQYPMLIFTAMLMGTSYTVALVTAFTGACSVSKHTSTMPHVETFAWLTLSVLVINFFLSISANLSPMTSNSRVRDMVGWSSLSSVHIMRIIFLSTLVYILRDSTLVNETLTFHNASSTNLHVIASKSDNHEINLDGAGNLMSNDCIFQSQHSPPRESLDKFQLISFFGDFDFEYPNALVNLEDMITDSSVVPDPINFKATTNTAMVGAVYTGLVFSVLSSITIGVALKFRDDFTVFTVNVPGVFEKMSQIAADIVVALCITSLILENELSACQPFNVDNTAVQCMFVSGALLVYTYIVSIFVNSVRRIDGVTTEGAWWSYSNMNMAFAGM